MILTRQDRAALVAGDHGVWKQFIAFARPYIVASIRKRGVTQNLSGIEEEDLVQDVYARLMEGEGRLLNQFDATKGSLPAFLTVVAGSQALNAIRAKSRQAGDTLDAVPDRVAPEECKTISSLLPDGLLSPRETLMLKCKYDRDMDAPDIAALLGLKAATVRVTLKSALDKLKANKLDILGDVA